VASWRLPLQQPGFGDELTYTLRHGIPAMNAAQFTALRANAVPKWVIYGAGDPQMSASDADATANRIGAPTPDVVPGRHLTMISAPTLLAADFDAFLESLAR
jgi:hypothetical protein